MIMWRYKLLLLVLFIPLTLYTLWQSLRAFELRYFLQRMAIFLPRTFKKGGIWIHAASVGEVNAVIPLILKLREEHPETTVTLTSNTMTSAAVVARQLPKEIQYCFFPLDYRRAIKRLVKRLKPKAVFIVETEFWPNLYHYLYEKSIPLTIINGRISEKTLYAKNWLKQIYARTLPLVNHVYARSETDKDRFIQLGMPAEKIDVVGNIKFYAPKSADVKPTKLERRYVLAASTRDNEEQLIVEAWLKADHKNLLLVIVPRHPQRLPEIQKQLARFSLAIAVRSQKDKVTEKTDVYIADTIGELKQFIAGAEFVLMGGSFVEKGGHNILEVAQLGKAVIFGPDMRNFAEEARLFSDNKAGIQSDLQELPVYFSQLIHDNIVRAEIEKNTAALIDRYQTVITSYYNILQRYTAT